MATPETFVQVYLDGKNYLVEDATARGMAQGALSTINSMGQSVRANTSAISALGTRVTTAETNITKVDTRVTQLTEQEEAHNTETVKQIGNLNYSMGRAEYNINGLTGRVDTAESDIEGLTTQAETLANRISNTQRQLGFMSSLLDVCAYLGKTPDAVTATDVQESITFYDQWKDTYHYHGLYFQKGSYNFNDATILITSDDILNIYGDPTGTRFNRIGALHVGGGGAEFENIRFSLSDTGGYIAPYSVGGAYYTRFRNCTFSFGNLLADLPGVECRFQGAPINGGMEFYNCTFTGARSNMTPGTILHHPRRVENCVFSGNYENAIAFTYTPQSSESLYGNIYLDVVGCRFIGTSTAGHPVHYIHITSFAYVNHISNCYFYALRTASSTGDVYAAIYYNNPDTSKWPGGYNIVSNCKFEYMGAGATNAFIGSNTRLTYKFMGCHFVTQTAAFGISDSTSTYVVGCTTTNASFGLPAANVAGSITGVSF